MARPRPAHDGFVVGLHAKSLRANMDVRGGGAACWPTTVAGLPGARLRIDIHHEVFDPGAHAYAPDVGDARCARSRPRTTSVELREHDYFSDDELWDYLNGARRLGAARTASARTRAGWRPASTSAPRSSRRAAASTPSSDRA